MKVRCVCNIGTKGVKSYNYMRINVHGQDDFLLCILAAQRLMLEKFRGRLKIMNDLSWILLKIDFKRGR